MRLVKKKILVITGTRADYGLLAPVIRELQKSRTLRPRLFVTGMHTMKRFGLTLRDILKDRFPIAKILRIPEKYDMLQALTHEIAGISEYCRTHRIDLILLLGDRDEMLAGAIVGGHLRIPIAHIAGGDVTGYVIDEAIRHSITKFSHLHFATNRQGAARIRQMGEEAWRIFLVGALGLNELSRQHFQEKIKVARKLGLDENQGWIVMLHHPTFLDPVSFSGQIKPLLSVLKEYHAEKLLIYPNSDTGAEIFIREIEKMRSRPGFHIFRNLSRDDYLSVLKNAVLLIGNSSSGIVESTAFHVPAVNIGNRQLGREASSNIINCGYTAKEIRDAMRRAMLPSFIRRLKHSTSFYKSGNVARKIRLAIERNIENPRLVLKRNFGVFAKSSAVLTK